MPFGENEIVLKYTFLFKPLQSTLINLLHELVTIFDTFAFEKAQIIT